MVLLHLSTFADTSSAGGVWRDSCLICKLQLLLMWWKDTHTVGLDWISGSRNIRFRSGPSELIRLCKIYGWQGFIPVNTGVSDEWTHEHGPNIQLPDKPVQIFADIRHNTNKQFIVHANFQTQTCLSPCKLYWMVQDKPQNWIESSISAWWTDWKGLKLSWSIISWFTLYTTLLYFAYQGERKADILILRAEKKMIFK